MENALVIGGTGLVGRYLLSELLENGTYKKVVVLTRSFIDLSHPNLEQKIVDFDSIDRIGFSVDDVYCCLGTKTKWRKWFAWQTQGSPVDFSWRTRSFSMTTLTRISSTFYVKRLKVLGGMLIFQLHAKQ